MPSPCRGVSPYSTLKDLIIRNGELLAELSASINDSAQAAFQTAESTQELCKEINDLNRKTDSFVKKAKFEIINIEKEDLNRKKIHFTDVLHVLGVLILGACAWFLVITNIRALF
jgi:hypothetical protein